MSALIDERLVPCPRHQTFVDLCAHSQNQGSVSPAGHLPSRFDLLFVLRTTVRM